MKTLEFTLPTPEENLACDEALLRRCERGASDEVLRFWEPRRHFVVLGLSNNHRAEAQVQNCRQHGIPILRRCSGGGTVLQGPGCLNFALVLRIRKPGPLENISAANRFVLDRHRQALEKLLGRPVEHLGCTDLALAGLKFSGNSQRRGMSWLLFHGTFLLRFDLPLMETYLKVPSRQPAYRRGRSHAQFVTNLPVPPDLLKHALREAWNAKGNAPSPTPEELSLLLRERYSLPGWNLRD